MHGALKLEFTEKIKKKDIPNVCKRDSTVSFFDASISFRWSSIEKAPLYASPSRQPLRHSHAPCKRDFKLVLLQGSLHWECKSFHLSSNTVLKLDQWLRFAYRHLRMHSLFPIAHSHNTVAMNSWTERWR